MATTQITLNETNRVKVLDLSQRLGKTPDELVNEVVEKYVAAESLSGKAAEENPRLRALGMYKGQIWMADDFNAPLSDGELKDWGL